MFISVKKADEIKRLANLYTEVYRIIELVESKISDRIKRLLRFVPGERGREAIMTPQFVTGSNARYYLVLRQLDYPAGTAGPGD